jgi:putative PIN family toxin of toxin-antitoxin system
VRAVLDPNVIISALLSPNGAPAAALREWQRGSFELIVSPLLLAELDRALAYPKLRRRIGKADAQAVVGWLGTTAMLATDPEAGAPVNSPDPDDDYLIALAAAQAAALVSGDGHLLGLAGRIPVFSPAEFIESLQER